MARISFDMTANTSGFTRALDEATGRLSRLDTASKAAGVSLDSMLAAAGKAAAALGATLGAKELVGRIASVRGEFQQLEIAFETMLGSAEQAQALMGQLVETAAKTPFDMRGVTQGAKQLLAYGVAAEEVNETITRLGDIAAGLSIPLGDLVYLYGTTMTQGRMYTMDLRQFMGRGVPVAEELARQFGVAREEVAGLVTAGKVGAEEFKAAIWSMTEEGGKFGGLMGKQSASITGQISNIQDSVQQMLNEMGKQGESVIKAALGGVASLVENYEKVGKAVLEAAAAYGSYRAILMTLTALQKTNIALQTASAVAAKAQAAGMTSVNAAMVLSHAPLKTLRALMVKLNATMLANPYVAVAAAVTALGLSVYKLATYQTEAQKQQGRLGEAMAEGEKKAIAERIALAELWSQLENAREGTEEYAKAKQELMDKYSRYGVTLDDESLSVERLAGTYDELTRAIEGSYAAKAKADFLSEETQSHNDLVAENLSKIKGLLLKQAEKGGVSYEEAFAAYGEVAEKVLAGELSHDYLGWDKTWIEQFGESTNRILMGRSGYFGKYLGEIYDSGQRLDKVRSQLGSLDAGIGLVGPERPVTGGGKASTVYGAEYEAARREWEEAKAGLEAIEADRDAFTTEQYRKAEERAKSAKEAYEGLGGDTRGAGGASASADAVAEGSFAWHEDRISEWSRRLETAATEGARLEAQAYIDAYTDELARLRAEHLRAQDDPAGWLGEISADNPIRTMSESMGVAAKETRESLGRITGEYTAAYALIFASADKLTRTQLSEAIRLTQEEIAKATASGDIEALGKLYAQLREQMAVHSANSSWGFGTVASGFRSLALARKYQAAADDTSRSEAERYEAQNKAINEQNNAIDKIATGAHQISQAFSEIGSALGKFDGALGQIGDLFSGLASNTDNIVTALTSNSKGDIISAGTSSAVSLVSMIGDQVQANKEYQEEWNRTVRECAHEYAMLQIEALDYEQQNIFGVENPYKELMEESEAYRASIEALRGLRDDLAAGMVQTGTKKVSSWKNVGTGAASGAGVGAAVGSVVPAIGTAIGAAAGAIIGGIAGLFGGRKRVAVYESLLSRYEWLYDEETYELNPRLLADYEKLDEDTRQVVDNWEEIRQKAEEAEETMRDSLSELSGDIGDDLSSALADAFTNGDVTGAIDDFHDKVTETIQDLIEQMVFSSVFGDLFDELEGRMTDSFASGGDQNIVDDLVWFDEEWRKRLEAYEQAMRDADAGMEALGYGTWEGSRTGSSKGIATASQDSVDENNARLTTIQGHTYQMAERTAAMAQQAAQTLALVSRLEGHAAQLARLENMEAKLVLINGTLSDMQSRGVLIKG